MNGVRLEQPAQPDKAHAGIECAITRPPVLKALRRRISGIALSTYPWEVHGSADRAGSERVKASLSYELDYDEARTAAVRAAESDARRRAEAIAGALGLAIGSATGLKSREPAEDSTRGPDQSERWDAFSPAAPIRAHATEGDREFGPIEVIAELEARFRLTGRDTVHPIDDEARTLAAVGEGHVIASADACEVVGEGWGNFRVVSHLAEDNPARAGALREAALHARENAESIARGFGLRLGPLLEVSCLAPDSGDGSWRRGALDSATAVQRFDGSNLGDVEHIEVSAEFTLKYRVE